MKSLYERLGGYDAIAGFMTDYILLLRADPKFARFAGGRGEDKRKRDVQLNIDYMCRATGGKNYYLGRDLKTAHEGLAVTESEWAANVTHMSDALDKHGIPQQEKREVLAILDHMREDIVEK